MDFLEFDEELFSDVVEAIVSIPAIEEQLRNEAPLTFLNRAEKYLITLDDANGSKRLKNFKDELVPAIYSKNPTNFEKLKELKNKVLKQK